MPRLPDGSDKYGLTQLQNLAELPPTGAVIVAGVRQVFGVIGSGNFHLTNAMVAGGAQFVAARHEGGAATMADAYSRRRGTVAAISVHQGCVLTNAMTGIAEAAKSRTPIIVVAAEATEPRSNFYVDQDALARAVGAVPLRITSAQTAVAEALNAVETAVRERRTVLLKCPFPCSRCPWRHIEWRHPRGMQWCRTLPKSRL